MHNDKNPHKVLQEHIGILILPPEETKIDPTVLPAPIMPQQQAENAKNDGEQVLKLVQHPKLHL